MFCVAEIDGVEQFSDQLELGVFCGDTCRATALAQALIIQDSLFHYLFVPTVAGENGHQLTFKLYDHSISQELNLIGPDPITFQENGYGTPIVPFVVSFTSPTMSTQTIALASGVNWVSFYIDITLDNLKAVLADVTPNSSITIKGKNTNTVYVPRTHKWNGTLDWDVNQMYKIIITTDCEIALEGMLLDPAEHPITITNGVNWIGFPLNVSMTPTNAFAGFAVNGDIIKSKDNNSVYSRNKWSNGVSSLEPGQGYIYNSAATNDRTFVFPASAKTKN